ncbi:hypothetical protein [Curtobacterium sp. B18]|uniref:hypothetical protein n=1 Tax=Curtobacterium sp. B18 TaxID=95614 RepID=UPI000346DB45|nr:hypothetical protein [Curtobacterium sp. B18]
MGLEFDYVNAWTKFIEGDPTTTGRAATANVISHLQWPVPKRLESSLESTMTKLAQLRNEVDAHDFFVLTTDAPTVEVLAYTVIQYFPGLDPAAQAVDDALLPLAGRTSDPDVSTCVTALGPATRILDRAKTPGRSLLRRAVPATTIRWVQPIPQLPDPLTAVLTTFIPKRADESFAAPLVDQFALGLVLNPDSQ